MQRPAATRAFDHLKVARERQPRRHPSPVEFERQCDRETVALRVEEAQAGADVEGVAADAEDVEFASPARRDHRFGDVAVGVHHRRRAAWQQAAEEPQLGGEIGIDGAVIVEVVARKIGEAGGGEADAVEALLLDAVRRGFEGEMGDPVAGERVEALVQPDRIGGSSATRRRCRSA